MVCRLYGKIVTDQSYGMGRGDGRELRFRSQTNKGHKEPIFIFLVLNYRVQCGPDIGNLLPGDRMF